MAIAAGTIHPTPPTTTAASRTIAISWFTVPSPRSLARLCGGTSPSIHSPL